MNKLLVLTALVVVLVVVYMQFGSGPSDTTTVSQDSSATEEVAVVAAEEVAIEAEEPVAGDTPSGTAVAVAGDGAAGGDLYGQFCMNCHGDDGAGLTTYNGELERLQFMLNGGSAYMPDFTGMFTEDEIANIHAFLTASE